MFDRYDAGEQAVLVHIYFTQDKDMEDLQEFESLVSSAGVEALQVITGSRKAPHPKYFVGEGKAVEIAEAVKATGASVVLFDHALSPAQERNLERLCECRVIDRTGLILDIFAQRARTHEGKLQVELAQLRHLATRLVRGWTHLERQKGGIGLRGPGETQLETDRRLLRNRIVQIQSRLERVEKQREQGRQALCAGRQHQAARHGTGHKAQAGGVLLHVAGAPGGLAGAQHEHELGVVVAGKLVQLAGAGHLFAHFRELGSTVHRIGKRLGLDHKFGVFDVVQCTGAVGQLHTRL